MRGWLEIPVDGPSQACCLKILWPPARRALYRFVVQAAQIRINEPRAPHATT